MLKKVRVRVGWRLRLGFGLGFKLALNSSLTLIHFRFETFFNSTHFSFETFSNSTHLLSEEVCQLRKCATWESSSIKKVLFWHNVHPTYVETFFSKYFFEISILFLRYENEMVCQITVHLDKVISQIWSSSSVEVFKLQVDTKWTREYDGFRP